MWHWWTKWSHWAPLCIGRTISIRCPSRDIHPRRNKKLSSRSLHCVTSKLWSHRLSILRKYFVYSSSAFSTLSQSLMPLSPSRTNAGTRDLRSMFDADHYAHSLQLDSRERGGKGLIRRALAHSNGLQGNVSCGCGKQFEVAFSLNHNMITSFWLHKWPRTPKSEPSRMGVTV